MTADFVLDASVALSWALRRDADGKAWEEVLVTRRAVVPSHWWLEIANALLVAVRARQTNQDAVDRLFDQFIRLRLITEPVTVTATAGRAVYELARSRGLTTYDAAYLELAERLELPLATVDRKLQSAAAGVGVEIVRP